MNETSKNLTYYHVFILKGFFTAKIAELNVYILRKVHNQKKALPILLTTLMEYYAVAYYGESIDTMLEYFFKYADQRCDAFSRGAKAVKKNLRQNKTTKNLFNAFSASIQEPVLFDITADRQQVFSLLFFDGMSVEDAAKRMKKKKKIIVQLYNEAEQCACYILYSLQWQVDGFFNQRKQ